MGRSSLEWAAIHDWLSKWLAAHDDIAMLQQPTFSMTGGASRT
jgi:hypothetical protein